MTILMTIRLTVDPDTGALRAPNGSEFDRAAFRTMRDQAGAELVSDDERGIRRVH